MSDSEKEVNEIGTTKNYSVTVGHVLRVKEIAAKLTEQEGKTISEGEALRRAIDLLYDQVFPKSS